jgi:valyl-tRNA synthetase
VRFYADGMIQQRTRLVHWSSAEKRAISGIELETVRLDGPTMVKMPGQEGEVELRVIHTFSFKLVPVEDQEDGELVVPTTRLESMLGNVAVAVHPDDPRYKDVIGRKLVHPFVVGRDVVVIGDKELVEKDIGQASSKSPPLATRTAFPAATATDCRRLPCSTTTERSTSATGRGLPGCRGTGHDGRSSPHSPSWANIEGLTRTQ